MRRTVLARKMIMEGYVAVARQKQTANVGTVRNQFENLLKTMEANVLSPQFEARQRSHFPPNAYDPTPVATPKYQRSESRVGKVLRPLDHLSRTKEHFYTTRILTRGYRASSQISRYVFEGEQSQASPIRIGIFAGLRGDDEVGPGAVSTFLADLVALPDLGNGLRIYAYPIVSAANFETATLPSRPSQYIINQIGCKILSSENYQIEREIFAIAFDGIITIRVEDEIENIKVGISDARLHDALVLPILSSLEAFLPNIEDGDCDPGRSLMGGVRVSQRPFELTLRAPSSGWQGLYALALRIALHTAVDGYRSYVTQNRSSGLQITGGRRRH